MNEEFKRMETIESMNILCITIQVTSFERANEYYTAEVCSVKKKDKLKQKP